MDTRKKFLLTGIVTAGVLILGSAGAAAVAHTLTVEDQAGQIQKIAPVTTGTTTPTPSGSHTPGPTDVPTDPTGTTTVAPAAPQYLDDHGGDGNDDGVGHDVGDDHGGAGSGGGSDDSGQHGGGSDDPSGHH